MCHGRALILRLREIRGAGGAAEIALPKGVRSVSEVDLRERGPRQLGISSDRKVSIILRPWQIATLALEVGSA